MTTGWSPYQQWFPYFKSHILGQFVDKCQDAMNTPHTVDAWCQEGAVCIFENLNSYTQAQLSGAQVLLGLAPTTLALLGPGINSLAILGSERPILSLLVAAGTATLRDEYPFARKSPLQPLSDAQDSEKDMKGSLPLDRLAKAWFVSPMEYLLAAAAAANTIHMSYDITRKTIVSWSCPNWAWVLCWSFVPLFIHVIGMFVFKHTVERTPPPPQQRGRTVLPTGEVQPPSSSVLARVWDWMLDKELRPCSQRVLPDYTPNYSFAHQLLWWLPRVLSYLQLLMGTAIFSSLLFVPIADTFPIIVRYALSAMASRCIVSLELLTLSRDNPSEAEGAASSLRWDSKHRSLGIAEGIQIKRS